MKLGLGLGLSVIRRGGSGGAPAELAITGLNITGLVDGDAVIWSTITPVATTTGSPDTVAYQFLLDDEAIPGATGAIPVDPSYDGAARLTVLVVAEKDGESVEALFGPIDVHYPAPVSLSTLPEITGTVGDAVSIDLSAYFGDGNPENSAAGSLSYAVTAGALPAGLSISTGAITGTLLSAVTDQAFTITASNSGGSVALASTATVAAGAGGDALHYFDFTTEAGASGWFKGDPDIAIAIDEGLPTIEPYASAGGVVFSSLVDGSVSAASNVRKVFDISAVPNGETLTIDVAVSARRKSTTATTALAILRTESGAQDISAGTVITTLFSNTTVAIPGTYWSDVLNQQFTHTKAAGETRLVLICGVANWNVAYVSARHLEVRTEAAIPTVNSVEITSLGKIGEAQTASVVVTPPETSVTLDWRVNGVSEGATFTPDAGDDLDSMTVAATPSGGAAVISAPVTITYPAPVVTTEPTITGTVNAGGDLVFTVGAASNAATIAYSLVIDAVEVATGSTSGSYTTLADTDTVFGTFTVTYTNSGGSVVRSLPVTVTGSAASGDAVILYSDSFSTDRTADFDDPAGITHLPDATSSLDDITGAMRFATTGGTSFTRSITEDIAAGQLCSVDLVIGIEGAATTRTWLRFIDGGGATIFDMPYVTTTGAVQLNYTVPSGATAVRVMMQLRAGSLVEASHAYILRKLRIADATETGPAPVTNGQYVGYGVEDTIIGNPIVADYGPAFSGTVTGYDYAGAEPHSWAGSVLTLTPSENTHDYATRFQESGGDLVYPPIARKIYARNGSLQSFTAASFTFRCMTWPTLEVNSSSVFNDFLESDHAYLRHVLQHITGGLPPYSYNVTSKPSWMIHEGGVLWAPDDVAKSSATTTVTVEVTDAAGDMVTVTWSCVVGTISRTPNVTITDATTLQSAFAAATGGAPYVIQLTAGDEYTSGTVRRIFRPANQPIIVLGATGATVRSINLDECAGIWFEGVTFLRTALPAFPDSASASNGRNQAVVASSLRTDSGTQTPHRFKGCVSRGYQEPSLDQETASGWAVRIRPSDSQPVYKLTGSPLADPDFLTYPLPTNGSEPYGVANYFMGFDVAGCIIQGSSTENCIVAYGLRHVSGAFNCTHTKTRKDCLQPVNGYGHVFYKVRPVPPAFFGNYNYNQEHRDSMQFIGFAGFPSHGVIIDSCIIMCAETPITQGIQINVGPNSTWGIEGGWQRSHSEVVFRNSIVTSELNNLFNPASLRGCTMERMVLYSDPRSPVPSVSGQTPLFRGNNGTGVDVTDAVIRILSTEVLPGGRNDPTYSFTNVDNHEGVDADIVDYFPNWNNASAPFLFPFEAGGGEPTDARFSAHGAAAVANPERIPTFLLPGGTW